MSYSDRPRPQTLSDTTLRVAALREPVEESEASLPDAITDVRRASQALTKCAKEFSADVATRRRSGVMQAMRVSAKR